MSILTHSDQMHHAAACQKFWRDRGYPEVKVWIEEETQWTTYDDGRKSSRLIPAMKSNLINGLPPTYMGNGNVTHYYTSRTQTVRKVIE